MPAKKRVALVVALTITRMTNCSSSIVLLVIEVNFADRIIFVVADELIAKGVVINFVQINSCHCDLVCYGLSN